MVWGTKANATRATTQRRAIETERFTITSKTWSMSLTQSQRNDWSALAAANPRPDRWGNLFPLTGISLFLGVNGYREQIGLPRLLNAPADQSVTALSTITITATAPNILTIAYTPTPLPADHVLYLLTTAQKNPGQNSFQHGVFFLGASAPAAASPFDASAAYTARWGLLKAGQKTVITAALLNTTNGAKSPTIEKVVTTT